MNLIDIERIVHLIHILFKYTWNNSGSATGDQLGWSFLGDLNFYFWLFYGLVTSSLWLLQKVYNTPHPHHHHSFTLSQSSFICSARFWDSTMMLHLSILYYFLFSPECYSVKWVLHKDTPVYFCIHLLIHSWVFSKLLTSLNKADKNSYKLLYKQRL